MPEGQAAEKGGQEKGGPKDFWATSKATAKAAAVVAVGFFAVLTFAGFLFNRHRYERASQIDAQLAQSTARLGREVELKYKNYRLIVDNVTRIMTQADSSTAAARQREVDGAKAAQDGARDREKQLVVLLNRAETRRQDALRRRRSAEATDVATRQQEALRETAYETAERKATKAQAEMAAANGTLQQKATALLEAQRALEVANQEVEAAQQALQSPPSASPAPAPSSPPSNLDAPLEQALDGRRAAETGVSSARSDLAAAEQAADAAAENASVLSYAAVARWLEWDAGSLRAGNTQTDALTAKQQASQASAAAAQTNSALKTAREEAEKKHQDLEAAANPPPAAEAPRYLKSLQALVLPSQVAELETCKDSATKSEVNVCVAKRMAELNQATDLEMVTCETANPIPSLSEDGRYLLIPPSGKTQPACGRVKLSRFLSGDAAAGGGEAPSSERVFEAVVLLRRDGNALLLRDASSNLRISALPGFDPKRADASGVMKGVALGTANYRAFLQPIRLRLAGTNPAKEATASGGDGREHADLVVCGLAREDRLEKASLSLSLPSYLWVVLLLALGLLLLPLGKLWLLGPKTPFQRLDVTVLATSALLFTLLGTTLALAFLAHNRLSARSDRQLTETGLALSRRVATSITAASGVLKAFDQQIRTSTLSPLLTREESRLTTEQVAACSAAGGRTADGVMFEDGSQRSFCERTRFPLMGPDERAWNHVFLLDPKGNERVKFAKGERDSTVVSVRSRPYFKEALARDTACLAPGPKGCAREGAPQFVRAVTSGNILLVVAEPVCKNAVCAPGEEPAGVAAVDTEMSAFRSLVLPLGVQAAVINRDGRVMLHSNNDAHHEQVLFDEVDDPDELRAALAARVATTVSSNYLGQASRIHIEPLRLPGTGWSVMTIMPTSIADVATVDMVIATVFGYGSLIGVVLLVACTFLVIRRFVGWLHGHDLSGQAHDHSYGLSLRPHAGLSREYAALGIYTLRGGAILCAVALLTTRLVPTTLLLTATCVMCAVAFRRIPSVCVDPDHPREGRAPDVAEGPRWLKFLPLTYLLCIAGLAEVFVMAPSATLFAGAHDHVADTLVRAELDHYASALRHREECLRWLPQGTAPEPLAGCGDVVSSGEERAGTPPSIGDFRFLRSTMLSPLPYLADLLPRIGSDDAEDSGRLYRIATVGRPDPPPSEYVTVREPTRMRLESTFDHHVVATVAVPPLVGIDYHWANLLLLLLIAGAAVAAAYTAGFHSVRRLFFLKVLMSYAETDPPPSQPLPSGDSVERLWNDASEPERRCLVQIAIGGYATPHPANVTALKQLVARGLIRRETLTIVDEELAEYVRQNVSPAEQAVWSSDDKSTAWAALRVPLTTGVVTLLGAVTMSNPELGFASAIVPTLAAGMPTVLRMLLGQSKA